MKKIFFPGLFALLFFSCQNHSENTNEQKTKTDSVLQKAKEVLSDTAKPIFSKGNIRVYDFDNAPSYADASLKMLKPEIGKVLPEGKVHFQYEVKNYELKMQTPGADMKDCANSDQGQHIHFILNDSPYVAFYTDTFTKALKPGHYINLSFLSRSFHESIKHQDAFVLNQFTVGKKKEKDMDLNAPMLFYSRPKGEYKGKDTKKILLDFYLTNVTLSNDGYKVKVKLNNETEFTLDHWKAVAITGLPAGENTVRLELVDKDGKTVNSPFNPVERKFKLLP